MAKIFQIIPISSLTFKNIVVKFEKGDLFIFSNIRTMLNLIGRIGTIRKLSASPGAEKSQTFKKLTLKK